MVFLSVRRMAAFCIVCLLSLGVVVVPSPRAHAETMAAKGPVTGQPEMSKGRSGGTDFGRSVVKATESVNESRLWLAQFWLRRAFQFAPDDGARRDVTQFYRDIAAAKALSVQVNISATPSDNVNDGSDVRTVWIGGLPFALDAETAKRSGHIAEAGIAGALRVSETAISRHELVGDIYARHVWLNPPANDAPQTAVGSDFNAATVALGWRSAARLLRGAGVTALSAMAGQTWYGGRLQSRWAEATASQSFPLADGAIVQPAFVVRRNRRDDSAENSATIRKAIIGWTAPANRNGLASLRVSREAVSSPSALIASHAVGAVAVLRLPSVLGLEPGATLDVERRRFDRWQSIVSGRRDETVRINLALAIPTLDFWGFAPQIDIKYRRTRSNVAIYDREGVTIGVTIASVF